MNTTVSIVIPVYNTAPFLDECIRSAADQTYPHLEILLVNDGSTDESPEICQQWCLRDSRIRLIHTPNQGPAMARNTGMDAATGHYICFLDSDDTLAPDTIEKALTTALKFQAEVVIFGLISLDREGRVQHTFAPTPNRQIYRNAEVQEEFLPALIGPKGREQRQFYMSACVMLYSLPHLRQWNWHFVSEREVFSEDVFSLLELFGHVQSVAVLPEALYRYRANGASFSRSYRPDRYPLIRHFYTSCIRLCRQMGYSTAVEKRLSSPYLAFTLAAIKQEAAAKRLAALRDIIHDDVLQQVLAQPLDHATPAQRLMYFAITHRWVWLCLLLATARNRADRLLRR